MKKPSVKRMRKEIINVGLGRWAGLLLAATLLVTVLMQLFAFEKFPGLLQLAGFTEVTAVVLAVALVYTEVLALPWLIGLQARSSVLRLSFCCLIIALQLLTVLVVFADMRGISILFSVLSQKASIVDFVWLGLLWVLFGIAIKTSKK
jgi:hypothetical protein